MTPADPSSQGTLVGGNRICSRITAKQVYGLFQRRLLELVFSRLVGEMLHLLIGAVEIQWGRTHICSSMAGVAPSGMDVACIGTGQAFVVAICSQVQTGEVGVPYA